MCSAEFDPEDPEWIEALRLTREALAKSRGYAPYWEWAIDRKRAEEHAAQVLRDFLIRSGEPISGTLSQVPTDPPDVLLCTVDNRRIGIEVTELVNGQAVERQRYLKKHGHEPTYEWASWTPETIAAALNMFVRAKDRKVAKATGAYDEIVLAIVTDEPLINQTVAAASMLQCSPTAERIGRAFLVLGYDPAAQKQVYPDGCPIFEIPLRKWSDPGKGDKK